MIDRKSKARVDKGEQGRNHKPLANFYNTHARSGGIEPSQDNAADIFLTNHAKPLQNGVKITATHTGLVAKHAQRCFKNRKIEPYKQRLCLIPPLTKSVKLRCCIRLGSYGMITRHGRDREGARIVRPTAKLRGLAIIQNALQSCRQSIRSAQNNRTRPLADNLARR